MADSTGNTEKMIAPCGIHCGYCYVHHKKKKPCPGCMISDEGKPVHCLKCKIKECAENVGISLCIDCGNFPCVLIKRMDKSYRTRYNESLIQNMQLLKERGMIKFLEIEKKRLTCPDCGGVVTIHYKQCTECGNIVH